MPRVANQTIRVVVPSVDPIHPTTVAKGETIPDEVLDLFEKQGWAEDGADGAAAATAAKAPIPSVAAAALGAAAAQAAAAVLAPLEPVLAAKMLRGQTIDGHTYDKGALVHGDIARRMIAAGMAREVAAATAAPETKA